MSFGVLFAMSLSLLGIIGLFFFASHINPVTGKWVARAVYFDHKPEALVATEQQAQPAVSNGRTLSNGDSAMASRRAAAGY